MAIHSQLPIYKVAYDLLDAATDMTKNMPRDYKSSIGGEIRKECVALITLIFRANMARDKGPHLTLLLEKVQVAELLIRLSKDKRFISIGQYANAIKLTDQIGKQANGWRKYAAS
jgi:hypothetical protein